MNVTRTNETDDFKKLQQMKQVTSTFVSDGSNLKSKTFILIIFNTLILKRKNNNTNTKSEIEKLF